VGAGDHRRDAVDEPDPGDIERRGGQLLERNFRDEPAEVSSERHQHLPASSDNPKLSCGPDEGLANLQGGIAALVLIDQGASPSHRERSRSPIE
jgi:hypothetical protein